MPKGGKRPGAGRPKGTTGIPLQSTIDKALHREALRAIVVEHLRPMTEAQVHAATGIKHFILRDPTTGKFERVTDPDRILAALNAPKEDGVQFYIYEKDPSTAAYADLMNRALDKPIEPIELDHKGKLTFGWED